MLGVGEELDVRMYRFFTGSDIEDSWVGLVDRFFPLPGNVGVVVALILFSIRFTAFVNNRMPFDRIGLSSNFGEFGLDELEGDVGSESKMSSSLTEAEVCPTCVAGSRVVAGSSSGQSCVISSAI